MRLGSPVAVALRGPVVIAPIRHLAWEPPYAAGGAQEMAKRQKKKKMIKKNDLTLGISRIKCSYGSFLHKVDSRGRLAQHNNQ